MQLKKYIALLVACFSTTIGLGQTYGDCFNSADACTNPAFQVSASGFGTVDELTGNTFSNPSTNPNPTPGNAGCLLSGELNSTWLLVTVTSNGTLEFSIGDGVNTMGCIDWAMWPYDATACQDIANDNLAPAACNWNGACQGITGMASPGNIPAPGVQADFEYALNVTAGDQFIICFSNYSSQNTSFPLDFFGTANVSCGGLTDVTICEGETAELIPINVPPNATINWDADPTLFPDNNGDTAYATPTVTTDYIVHITDAAGTVDDTATVTVIPTIVPNITVVNSACSGGSDGEINISITSGGLAPFTYEISGSVTQTNSTGSFTALPAGTYTVDIVDDHGCSYQTTADVLTGNSLSFNLTSTDVSCYGECDGSATMNVTSGNAPYTYTWSNGIAGTNDNIANNVCAGSYTVTVTDVLGCTRDTTFSVNEPSQVIANTNPDTTICENGAAQLTASASGGSGAYTFNWDNGINNANQSVNPTTVTSYCVTATDADGCISDPACTEVDLNPSLSLAISNDTTICPGDNANLNANASDGNGGPYSYTWTDPAGITVGTGASISVSPQTNTTYTLTVSDNCESTPVSLDVTVTVVNMPVFDVTADQYEGCQPLTVNFTNNSVPQASDCYWDFGNGNSSTDCNNVSNTYLVDGSYDLSLQLTTTEGCVIDTTMQDVITVHPNPVASFEISPNPGNIYDNEISFTNNSIGADFSTWYLGYEDTLTDFEPTYTFPDLPGSHNICLVVETNDGCSDSLCQELIIEDRILIYVPNSFTPDGDGINDILYPVIEGYDINEFQFTIFNRWGEVIFESDTPSNGWDGSANNSVPKSDTYVWKLVTRERTTGKVVEKIGHVTLLR